MESKAVPTGLPGVSMNVGDHICAFYRGTLDRDQVLVPYLRAGLEGGEKCIGIIDSTDPDELSAILAGEGRADEGQLSLHRSEDSYLLEGSFSPAEMLDFWERIAQAVFAEESYALMRAVGEMTWALRNLPGVDLLTDYEAELNRFIPRYPQAILCLYDLEKFTDGEVLIEILRTHPKVLMSRVVLENPWYMDPDQFLARAN